METDQKTPTDKTDTSPEPEPPPQFSLAALLWFVLVWSVYFSQFAILEAVRRKGMDGESGLLAVFVAWCLMMGFYLRHRLYVAIYVHCFAPTFAFLFFGALSGENLLNSFLIGACLGTILSFPVAVVSLITRVFKR